jgi:hypothetical protein
MVQALADPGRPSAGRRSPLPAGDRCPRSPDVWTPGLRTNSRTQGVNQRLIAAALDARKLLCRRGF